MKQQLKFMVGGSALFLGALVGCTETESVDKTAVSETAAVEWPVLTSAVAPDPAVEARIDALLAKMTLEHKVGQLMQPELRQITPEDIKKYHVGAVLNGGGAFPGDNKYARVEDWVALADAYYHASMDDSDGGIAIPIFWGTDAVHGHNNVIGATIFPHNIGLGAMRNPELVRQIGEVTAREIAATGIDWNFAPTLAVVRDDRWGRTYESYSEDPAIVKAYGGKMVEGLQGRANTAEFMAADRVIATAKHFIADGGTLGGVDRGDADITEAELLAIHAPGYFTAIEAGVQTVMASFSSWQGRKMHGHDYLLTDILKNRMGFDGLVVGDWNGHEFVPGCTKVSCPHAINAGLDIFMAPDADWKELYANTLAQVKSGEISEARLNDAVRRILRVKIRAGLFEKGAPSTRAFAGKQQVIGAPEHRAVARQAVRESLVLLKNKDQLLPLSPKANVLVAGDGADNIGKQSGGWTISWQGTGNTNDDFPGGSSIYQGIAESVAVAGGKATLSVDGEYTEKPDVAIVVFGENPYAEMQGDVKNLAYNNPDDLALLKKLKAEGIPVVSLFITGRPLWVNRELNASDAFAVIWHPGSEGAGVADVLFTDKAGNIQHDFKGKLSFSWPATPVQSPLNVGEKNYTPLFAYGYGLSYQDKDVLGDDLSEEMAEVAVETDKILKIFDNRPLDPWQLIIADGHNNTVAVTGSTASLATISLRAVDRNVQEDSRRLQWNGTGRGSAGFYSQSRTDLVPYLEANAALLVDVKVDERPTADVRLGVFCGQDCVAEKSITENLQAAPQKEWITLSIALKCLATDRAKMDMILSPFYLVTEGKLDLSLYNLRIEKDVDAAIACD
jgi:Beta-glucosidase-related glycosidases